MSDPITEIIDDIQHNGVRWVTVIAIMGLIRKERRNHLLNRRDEAIFHNLRILMEDRGLGDQWKDGPRLGLQSTDLPSLKQWLIISWKAALKRKKYNYPRRKTKMNSQNINYVTLIPTILGAAKLILQTFGIVIPDATLNEVVNGAAAVGTIIGIFLAHRKSVAIPQNPQEPNQTF